MASGWIDMVSLLSIRNLHVDFATPTGLVRAADDVSLELEEDEILALVGETGCGKSVVASSILGLLPENARVRGRVTYGGRELLELSEGEMAKIRGKEISIIFQNPSLALNPVYCIGDQISEPLIIHGRSSKRTEKGMTKGVTKETAWMASRKLMQKLGFHEAEKEMRMYPFQFSGGMNQRAMIAASVVMDPRIIIADEPTKGLDGDLVREVVGEIKFAREMKGSSVLLITHDLHIARSISDRIAIMYAGEVLEVGDTADFFRKPSHPYSQALIKSLPEKGFVPVPGQSPSMVHPPAGCKFHPRCPRRFDKCSLTKPALVPFGGSYVRCHLFA